MGDVPQGLFAELLWVHGALRQDLGRCRDLARAVADDLSVEDAVQQLDDLTMRGVLFQLRIGCLRHCQFVHAHHGGEDAHLFPALRRQVPTIADGIDRLVADHREISDLLDEVERHADALSATDAGTRTSLAAALDALADKLLDHLDREEALVGPTLNTWGP